MPSPDFVNRIPQAERDRYAHYLYHYGSGDAIIHEGQTDATLYLLRLGSVGVYRQVLGEEKQIAAIDAVNIFGEMAAILESPRTATVRVTSEEAVLYKFPAVDLKTVAGNPAWAELLLTRLCTDVRDTNNRNVALQSQNEKAALRSQEMLHQSGLIFSALLRIQAKIAALAVMNSKEWHFLNSLREMTLQFLKKNLTDVYDRTGEEGSDAAIHALIANGVMPEYLRQLLK